MTGKDATKIPVVDADPTKPSALPTADSKNESAKRPLMSQDTTNSCIHRSLGYQFFSEWEKKSDWKNEVTLRRFVNLLNCEIASRRTNRYDDSVEHLRGNHPSHMIHRIAFVSQWLNSCSSSRTNANECSFLLDPRRCL